MKLENIVGKLALIGSLALNPFYSCNSNNSSTTYKNDTNCIGGHEVCQTQKDVDASSPTSVNNTLDYTNHQTLATSIVAGAKTPTEKVLKLISWEMKNFFHAYTDETNQEFWGLDRYEKKRIPGDYRSTIITLEEMFEQRITGCPQASAILITLLQDVGLPAEMTLTSTQHTAVYIPSLDRYIHGDYLADFALIEPEKLLMTKETMDFYAQSPQDYLLFEDEMDQKGKYVFGPHRKGNCLYVKGSLDKTKATPNNLNWIQTNLPEYNIKFQEQDKWLIITSDCIPIQKLGN